MYNPTKSMTHGPWTPRLSADCINAHFLFHVSGTPLWHTSRPKPQLMQLYNFTCFSRVETTKKVLMHPNLSNQDTKMPCFNQHLDNPPPKGTPTLSNTYFSPHVSLNKPQLHLIGHCQRETHSQTMYVFSMSIEVCFQCFCVLGTSL